MESVTYLRTRAATSLSAGRDRSTFQFQYIIIIIIIIHGSYHNERCHCGLARA